MTKSVSTRQDAVNQRQGKSTPRTPAGDALSELVVQVFRLDGLLTATGDALAQPAGQTSARWRVLATVDGGPATVAQVARAWGLARQSVQRVADVLVDERFCRYDENPGHRRAQFLRITPRGRRALRTIQAAQRTWADAMGAEIGEADLQRANEVLARTIRAVMDQQQQA
jgi:DNA-binding MarR family transcriptional regulator